MQGAHISLGGSGIVKGRNLQSDLGSLASAIHVRSTLCVEDMQDGRKVETKIRLKGKLKGQQYKVFRSPDGTVHYTVAAALQNGFKGYVDGTCPKAKARGKGKAKAKAKAKVKVSRASKSSSSDSAQDSEES